MKITKKIKKIISKIKNLRNKATNNLLTIKKQKKDAAISLLISSLFIPSFYYFYTIRKSEYNQKEPYLILLLCYFWGMFPAVFLTFILYSLIEVTIFKRYLFNLPENTKELIDVSIVAPLVEEFTKGIGLFFFKKYLDEEEDYLIYGAISGLGFATIENFLYSLLGKSSIESIVKVIIRQLTSTILHIFASSKFGEGMKFIIDKQNRNLISFLKLYFESFFYHAAHNFSISIINNPWLIFLNLIIIIILYNLLVISRLKKKITELDRK